MIPTFSEVSPIQAKYLSFIERLKASEFSGDTNPEYEDDFTFSVADPIYNTLPQGVIYPKSSQDIRLLVSLATQEEFHDVIFRPKRDEKARKQSLERGLIVDIAKYMARTLEMNQEDSMFCHGHHTGEHFASDNVMCLSWKTKNKSKAKNKKKDQKTTNKKQASKAIVPSKKLSFLSRTFNTLVKSYKKYDFENEVYDSMTGCLACKAHVEQYPTHVDKAAFRAKFLEMYYNRYLRPTKDHMIGSIESIMPKVATFPRTYNNVIASSWFKYISRKHFGIVDTPALSSFNLKKEIPLRGIRIATPAIIESLSYKDRSRTVILLQDVFTSYFDTELLLDTLEILSRLDFNVYLAPYTPNGKMLHTRGFLKAFNKTASDNLDMIQSLSFYNLPFIGIDPSITLSYRSEYQKAFGEDRQVPKVYLVQEWLAEKKEHLINQPLICEKSTYHLLPHHGEQNIAPDSIPAWQQVYDILGLELQIEEMNGTNSVGSYGHEIANSENAMQIYKHSLQEKVSQPELKEKLVATGYSSRSLVKRFDDQTLLHPIQALLRHIRELSIHK